MNTITETIGKWGTTTSPDTTERRSTPRPGDLIEFADNLRHYPVSNRLCRIDNIDDEEQRASVVNGMGSAFLDRSGHVSISGGPFFSLPLSTLRPTERLEVSRMWNWGHNSPGANQGVHYTIKRPVFQATDHPDSYKTRHSRHSESDARQGGEYRHGPISDFGVVVATSKSHDGLTRYSFYDPELAMVNFHTGDKCYRVSCPFHEMATLIAVCGWDGLDRGSLGRRGADELARLEKLPHLPIPDDIAAWFKDHAVEYSELPA